MASESKGQDVFFNNIKFIENVHNGTKHIIVIKNNIKQREKYGNYLMLGENVSTDVAALWQEIGCYVLNNASLLPRSEIRSKTSPGWAWIDLRHYLKLSPKKQRLTKSFLWMTTGKWKTMACERQWHVKDNGKWKTKANERPLQMNDNGHELMHCDESFISLTALYWVDEHSELLQKE